MFGLKLSLLRLQLGLGGLLLCFRGLLLRLVLSHHFRGLLFGVIGAGLLVHALGVSAYVSPSVTGRTLGIGLLVGIAIGVLGGIYPAWRVTRMRPMKGLGAT